MPAVGGASAAAMNLKQILANPTTRGPARGPSGVHAPSIAIPLVSIVIAAGLACANRAAAPAPSPGEPTTAPSEASSSVSRPDADEAARWAESAHAEAERLRAQFPNATVRIAVLDAGTGRVLAQEGPVQAEHDTGSTIKSLTVAAALEEGATPQTEVDCSAPVRVAGKEISDYAVHGRITVREALARSSNVAIAQLTASLGWQPLYDRVAKLVPLPDPEGLSEADAVMLLFGGTSRLSTLDLARAYAIVAAGGRDPVDGAQRIDAAAADEVVAMLEHAVTGEHGTGREATVPGVEIAGKTGTARVGERQTALFVGIVGPAGDRRVVAVVVENVAADAFGSTVAAPAFARIVQRVRAPG